MQDFRPILNSLKKEAIRLLKPEYSPGEKLLLLLILAYLAITGWAAYRHGVFGRIDFMLYATSSMTTLKLFVNAIAIYLCFKLIWWTFTIRPRPKIRDWWPMLDRDLKLKERCICALPMFIGVLVFLTMATNMKGFISYYGDYIWDPLLADWDRKLHFGVDPWRILQPVLGYPMITAAINYVYVTWFFALAAVVYWQLFSLESRALRLQFFYTFFFTWGVSGTLLAILFASGGPCFYEVMTGDQDFSELMTYLHQSNQQYEIFALSAQEYLLDLYEKDHLMIGSGISAMPSMHVATSFLFYLVAVNRNKWLGGFFGIFCLIILIGSVHLAWHYALDGYISIVLTWGYWKLSGWIITRVEAYEGVYPMLKGAVARLF